MEHRFDRDQCVSFQVDRARVAVLRPIQIDRAAMPVELAHLHGVLLAEPHPRVNPDHELAEVLR